MITNLSNTEFVTLIGIIFTLLVGILNLFLTSHKNHTDFITSNRMTWVSSVRQLSSKIISWRHFESTQELLNLINQLIIYLNISNEIDNTISTELLEMYDDVYKLSLYEYDLTGDEGKRLFEGYYRHKQQFNILIRIYLKKEWTRIKAESRLIKIPFYQYWIPFYGFSEKWATSDLMKKYKSIENYKYEPWIEVKKEVYKKSYSPHEYLKKSSNEDRIDDNIDATSRKEIEELRKALLAGQDTIITADGKIQLDSSENEESLVKVPSGHLAGNITIWR